MVAATLFSLGSPVYALVAAVVVSDLDAAQTRKLALPRVLGTALGGGIGCLATLLFTPGPVAVAFGVLLPMYLCQLLRFPAAARVAGYVSGIIIFSFAAHPWSHAVDRLFETLLGIAAAWLVSIVPALYRPAKARDEERSTG